MPQVRHPGFVDPGRSYSDFRDDESGMKSK
jgi:hypothetical protein